MKEAEFISRTEQGDTELEFGHLRKVGIDVIQKLGGKHWTDYNLHDPGITILEQVCFAITELGYKTAFHIKDLIASQNGNSENSDTFFSAAQILEGKPITINDYRKLLIDRVEGLRDVWIKPLNLKSEKDQIKGIYKVSIQRSPERIVGKSKSEKLIRETRRVLEKYSNLGEAFEDIQILDEVEIIVNEFEIDLEKEANAEKTHAEVLFTIKNFISRPIKFYSLDQMQNMGFSIEEIFDGPKLHNGFIKDNELSKQRKTLLTSNLINILDNVEGVSKVRSIKIGDEDKWNDEKGSHINIQNKVPVIAKIMMPYNSGYQEQEKNLRYYQNNERVSLFRNKVIRYFRQLEKESYINYKMELQKSNDIVLQKGKRKPIIDYYSIQEDFPGIYATGSQGIPPSFDTVRVNQVKQLKAYLLFFEQILTNYLAQLTNFAQLFSLDKTLAKSYFPGSLETVPYIRELFKELKDKSVKDNELKLETERISQKALFAIEDFYRRRHMALDHLLARFGEKVSVFGFDRFNYYYDEDTLNRLKTDAKIDFLKELVFLSSNRARSFNTDKEFWTKESGTDKIESLSINISYLEKKARIRLGLKMQNIKIAAYRKKHVDSKKAVVNFSINKIIDQLSKNNRLGENELILTTITDPKLLKEDFQPEISIDNELLRRGIWAENFKLISYADDSSINLVGFSRNLNLSRGEMAEKTREDIHHKLMALCKDLKNKPKHLRFWIKEKNKEKLIIEFEKEEIKKEENETVTYKVIPTKIWSIIKECKTKNEAENYIQSMTNYLAHLNINMEGFYLVDHIELRPRYPGSYNRDSNNQINKTDAEQPDQRMEGETNDAAFYSFRVSIVIPSWPSRFADPEFRKIMESTIREDAPAHIGIEFHYLDFKALEQFEKLYSKWLVDLKKFSDETIEKLNLSSNALVLFMKKLESEAEKEQIEKRMHQ